MYVLECFSWWHEWALDLSWTWHSGIISNLQFEAFDVHFVPGVCCRYPCKPPRCAFLEILDFVWALRLFADVVTDRTWFQGAVCFAPAWECCGVLGTWCFLYFKWAVSCPFPETILVMLVTCDWGKSEMSVCLVWITVLKCDYTEVVESSFILGLPGPTNRLIWFGHKAYLLSDRQRWAKTSCKALRLQWKRLRFGGCGCKSLVCKSFQRLIRQCAKTWPWWGVQQPSPGCTLLIVLILGRNSFQLVYSLLSWQHCKVITALLNDSLPRYSKGNKMGSVGLRFPGDPSDTGERFQCCDSAQVGICLKCWSALDTHSIEVLQ